VSARIISRGWRLSSTVPTQSPMASLRAFVQVRCVYLRALVGFGKLVRMLHNKSLNFTPAAAQPPSDARSARAG